MIDMSRLLRLITLITGVIRVPPGRGTSGTPSKVYVLGDQAAADPMALPQMNVPLVEERPTRVSDFLDTPISRRAARAN